MTGRSIVGRAVDAIETHFAAVRRYEAYVLCAPRETVYTAAKARFGLNDGTGRKA